MTNNPHRCCTVWLPAEMRGVSLGALLQGAERLAPRASHGVLRALLGGRAEGGCKSSVRLSPARLLFFSEEAARCGVKTGTLVAALLWAAYSGAAEDDQTP